MNKTPSIIVVDDEQHNFDVIEILLFKEGYDLRYASSGDEAIRQLEAQQADVILLDVMMPVFNGFEVCRTIKANPKWQHIPILMVTALTAKEDLAKGLEMGADDFISKPVSGIELRARVRSMLRIKHQYDMLQELLQVKEASLQLREDMAYAIVHDLRNPLASILFACDILSMADLDLKQKKRVDRIVSSGQRLKFLIDNLLIMAKIDAGKLVLNCTEVDLYNIAKDVISEFQQIANQNQVKLIAHLPKPGKIFHLDDSLIRRVIDNLLSNAIKFSPSKGQVELKIDYLSEEKFQIQVKDWGKGVSEELRQSIFEKYEVGELAKGVAQTGLGLSFCKLVVEAHGGRIFVESNQPKGAIFTVEI
ncbi:response regulator [Aerosakkonema sp. BLCC-F183]|uniref:hybrid sensor histidine kinase/response regulator n=1 Tax=Aerosakkonema sp. BLCC-F183 TaxID=3342834 RepID=UPI0035BAA506